jgi:hypothetical protein
VNIIERAFINKEEMMEENRATKIMAQGFA